MTAQFGQVSKTGVRINPVINFTGTNWRESQQIQYFYGVKIIRERTYSYMLKVLWNFSLFPCEAADFMKTTTTPSVFLFIHKIKIKILSDALSAVASNCGLAVISVHPLKVPVRLSHSAFGCFRISTMIFFFIISSKIWESQSHSNIKQKPFWSHKKHPQNMTLCTVDVSRLSN